jgi:hypothetical protein
MGQDSAQVEALAAQKESKWQQEQMEHFLYLVHTEYTGDAL